MPFTSTASHIKAQRVLSLLLCTSHTIRSAVAFATTTRPAAFGGRTMTASAISTTTTRSSSSSNSNSSSRLQAVKFAKYEGLGNDFILVDDRDKMEPSLSPEQSAKLCNRNFGIGGDGVIFALKPPCDDYDFTMRIYNSDGSEPEMCGNGIRCFAQFLKDLGADGKSIWTVVL